MSTGSDRNRKVCALIPAYRAGKTLEKVLKRIPAEFVQKIIVVDDGSPDDTSEVLARHPEVTALRHEVNRGYAQAQITLYRAALASDCDIFIILHADCAHYPEEIPAMLSPIVTGPDDMVVGSRMLGLLERAAPMANSRFLGAVIRGEMPGYKVVANCALTTIQNVCCGTRFNSFHDGFRAITREALVRVPFDSFNVGYLYDATFLVEAHRAGLRIAEIPVGSCYDADAGSSVPVMRYGFQTLAWSFDYLRRGALRRTG